MMNPRHPMRDGNSVPVLRLTEDTGEGCDDPVREDVAELRARICVLETEHHDRTEEIRIMRSAIKTLQDETYLLRGNPLVVAQISRASLVTPSLAGAYPLPIGSIYSGSGGGSSVSAGGGGGAKQFAMQAQLALLTSPQTRLHPEDKPGRLTNCAETVHLEHIPNSYVQEWFEEQTGLPVPKTGVQPK